MLIGQFNDSFPPELDGVGRVVKSYAEELNLLGDDCIYIAPRAPGYENNLNFKTLHFEGIKVPKEKWRLGLPLIDIHYLRKVKYLNFDIVHMHSPFTAGREAARIAKKHKIPLVGTFHSKFYDDFYQKTHSKLIAKIAAFSIARFYEKCDEVWTLNNSTAEVLRSYGYRGDIVIMPNGTNIIPPDAETIERVRQQFALPDCDIFLFVGQMNWKKNIKRIIDGFKIYAQKNPDCVMVMAGQGPNEKDIKKYVTQVLLDEKFIFTGHIPDRNILMGLYANAKLFVFPSIYDNAPMTVREAASVGVPSLLIRGSCSAEGIVHNENGFLCEDTSESLAEGIENAVTKYREAGVAAEKTIPLKWSEIIHTARERYVKLIEKKIQSK